MTPLETGLITVIGGLIVGVAVRLITKNNNVSRSECDKRHKHESDRHDQIVQDMQSMRQQLQAQTRMIRALVVHSGMDKAQQQEILNCENENLASTGR